MTFRAIPGDASRAALVGQAATQPAQAEFTDTVDLL